MSGTLPLIEPMSISNSVIRNTRDDTVRRAAELLNLPELLAVHSNRVARLRNLRDEKRIIESDPDFGRAEFLIDPKHGEFTVKLADKKRQRSELHRRQLAFHRHPTFSALRNGKTFGLTLVGIVAVLTAFAAALGAIGLHSGSIEATLVFWPIFLVGLTIAIATPKVTRSLVAQRTAHELGFRNILQAQQAFGELSNHLGKLGQEINTLRDREVRVSGLVLRHKRIMAELCDYEARWLEELRSIVRKAVGEDEECQATEPTSGAEHEQAENPEIVIDIELELAPSANVGQARWDLYGTNAVMDEQMN